MSAATTKLKDVASIIRSKNAGPYELTFDVMFSEEAVYRRVKERQLFSREWIAECFRIPLEQVLDVHYFDPALAVKFNLRRSLVCGAIGDTDIYGAQQHAPLLEARLAI